MQESKEAYFVALRRKGEVKKENVWKDDWLVLLNKRFPFRADSQKMHNQTAMTVPKHQQVQILMAVPPAL